MSLVLDEFLADYGSTTAHFKRISNNYRLVVLKEFSAHGVFSRCIIIYVDEIPVILGLSCAHIDDSPLFADILMNAGSIPIGTRLFAKDSGISRNYMVTRTLDVANIDDMLIKQQLQKLNINGTIHYRASKFVSGLQSMRLDEYFLPGLTELLITTKHS